MQNASSPLTSSPWWVNLCEWLSRQRSFFWGNIIFGIVLNIFAAWLITPSGSAFSNTPLGIIFVHPWIAFLVGTGLIILSIAVQLVAHCSRAAFKAFEHQDDAYRFLINMIDRDGAKEAILLQYSCKTSLNVVRMLLRKGAKVTVFIQHEDTAAKIGSQFQADRIIDTTNHLRSDLGDALSEPDKLKVYKYRAPSSMSAIKIDSRVLCMGFYTYEQKDYTGHRTYTSDITEVSGHDRAAIVVCKGTDEYQAFNKTFKVLEKNYRKNAEEVLL